MKKMVFSFQPVFLILLYFSSNAYSIAPNMVNRVEGHVYDPNRNPIENVRVELLNDVESTFGSTKTITSGRFSFVGMPDGRYSVRVLPFGTNFIAQTQEVQLTNTTNIKNDVEYVEIYLTYDKRLRGASVDSAPEVLFVQDISLDARNLYNDGADDLKEGRTTGTAKLEKALEISPKYFDALSLLGRHYILEKNYEKGYPYLLRAIDINPRSFSCYFRLGYAFYQLKQYPAALQAARASAILSPSSFDAQSLYGTVARISGNYDEAEKALQRANTLANNKNSDTHMQLALLFNHLNKNQAAIDELQIFLKLEPKTPDKAKIEALIVKLKAASSKTK